MAGILAVWWRLRGRVAHFKCWAPPDRGLEAAKALLRALGTDLVAIVGSRNKIEVQIRMR